MMAHKFDLFKLKYEREKKFDKYYGDFYLPEIKLDIECDGTYWHRNIKERDRKKDDFMNSMGINVMRIPECQIDDFQIMQAEYVA